MRTIDLSLPHDEAVRGIVLMNVVVYVGALVSGEGLVMLMLPYWFQSVVIGYYAVRRIQKLRHFATDNLKMNGKAVAPTPDTQRRVWMFFALHYGFFHVVYFLFLGAFASTGLASGGVKTTLGPLDTLWIGATVIGFLVSHGASHREHVADDLRGTPNIGALMFVPYIRIVPMHLTIILGALLGRGLGMLLFVALKTAADVAMHRVEHRLLQRGSASSA